MERTVPAAGPDRFLLGIIIGTVALIAIAVVLVVAGQPATSRPADPASPVGVVQGYVEAIQARDIDRAYGYLSSNAQRVTSLDDYRKMFRDVMPSNRGEQRLVIEPVSEEANRAEVKVTISRLSVGEGPFAAGTMHYDVTVVLVRENGAWRIDVPAEPFPFFVY